MSASEIKIRAKDVPVEINFRSEQAFSDVAIRCTDRAELHYSRFRLNRFASFARILPREGSDSARLDLAGPSADVNRMLNWVDSGASDRLLYLATLPARELLGLIELGAKLELPELRSESIGVLRLTPSTHADTVKTMLRIFGEQKESLTPVVTKWFADIPSPPTLPSWPGQFYNKCMAHPVQTARERLIKMCVSIHIGLTPESELVNAVVKDSEENSKGQMYWDALLQFEDLLGNLAYAMWLKEFARRKLCRSA